MCQQSIRENAKVYENHFRSEKKKKKRNGKIDCLIDECRKCSTEKYSAGNLVTNRGFLNATPRVYGLEDLINGLNTGTMCFFVSFPC